MDKRDKRQTNPRRRWTRDPGLVVQATQVHCEALKSMALTECEMMKDELETNLLNRRRQVQQLLVLLLPLSLS